MTAAAGLQSSSSPRLPSPPPLAEVQIGGSHPVGDSFAEQQSLGYGRDDNNDDVGATRRVRPGTKADDMAAGPPLIPLSQLDSPFQLQEHLKALHNHYTRPEDSDTVLPVHRDVAVHLAIPPEGVDRALWLYELCRFLTVKLNNLIVAFFAESPPCSAQTCPEMQASEWQYLCAVHDPPKTCCAIDYCCHTLDWATNILTSPKYFPSRLTLGSEASGGPQASMRHLINIFRRLYRIFAHAWYRHREVFWLVEGHEGLYVFFKTVCDVYHLMPEDSYTVPAEAEGIEPHQTSPLQPESPAREEEPVEGKRMTILKKDDAGDMCDAGLGSPATTRRHKQSPSTDLRGTSIAESAEDTEELPKPLVGMDEQPAEEEKADESKETEPIPTAGEATGDQKPTEEPSQEETVGVLIATEDAKPEEPESTESEQPQPTSTGQQVEPKRVEEEAAEPEASKPKDEGESLASTEEPTAEASKPAPEPEETAEPESKAEAEAKEEAEKPASEPAKES